LPRWSYRTLREDEEDQLDQKYIDHNDQQRRDHYASGRRSAHTPRSFISRVAQERRNSPNDESKDCCLNGRRVEVGPLERSKRLSNVHLEGESGCCIFREEPSENSRKIEEDRQDGQSYRTSNDSRNYKILE